MITEEQKLALKREALENALNASSDGENLAANADLIYQFLTSTGDFEE